jgi:hypothetical protein
MRTRVLLPLLACIAGCVAGDVPRGAAGDVVAYQFGACAEDLRGAYGTGPVLLDANPLAGRSFP